MPLGSQRWPAGMIAEPAKWLMTSHRARITQTVKDFLGSPAVEILGFHFRGSELNSVVRERRSSMPYCMAKKLTKNYPACGVETKVYHGMEGPLRFPLEHM